MHSERGLTLVEVLLTTALLSMGLLAVANMQMVSMRVNTTSANLTQATLAAQEVAEWIMSLSFDDPLLMDETDPGIATTYHDPDPPIGYSIRWEVDTSSANSKIVNIVTTWGSIESQKSISLPMQISTYTNS
jgi:prepilin-type N-terminal cleavage/methylation domain-containing protein